jgi:hypothetical protein
MRMRDIFFRIAFVSISLAAGIAAAVWWVQLRPGSGATGHSAITSINVARADQAPHTRQPIDEFSSYGSQADILELPKANADFVGEWGGFIHSSIQRLNPDLIGASPDRVSIVFGRRGGTVFMVSELYSSPTQRIVRRPKASITGARLVIVEYESADRNLYYVYSDRFHLRDGSHISYRSTVEVYGRDRRQLMGVVTEHATLKRLRTRREQHEFARPGPNQIPRAEISASERVAPR